MTRTVKCADSSDSWVLVVDDRMSSLVAGCSLLGITPELGCLRGCGARGVGLFGAGVVVVRSRSVGDSGKESLGVVSREWLAVGSGARMLIGWVRVSPRRSQARVKTAAARS